jgi:hypothetical protein
MIVFDLLCDNGHGFEGWFGSSDDFAAQQGRGLVTCPQCGSGVVGKAPMAPSVGRKGNQIAASSSPRGTDTRQVANAPMPPQVVAAMRELAAAQARALEGSTWVGEKFVEQSRAMHYGERDHAPIHGQATIAEAKALAEEGVPVAALPFPVAPPEELN